MVGLEVSDDAAVWKISDDVAVIQTLDFFPPVVDDPYDYGAIAAANAMSDIYAMGGEVVLALNILGFPSDMDPGIVAEILRGGAEKVAEGSPVVEDLQALCARGVEVLACGTCLGYYNLKDKVAVGQVSNMYSIAETMFRAGKVVHL